MQVADNLHRFTHRMARFINYVWLSVRCICSHDVAEEILFGDEQVPRRSSSEAIPLRTRPPFELS